MSNRKTLKAFQTDIDAEVMRRVESGEWAFGVAWVENPTRPIVLAGPKRGGYPVVVIDELTFHDRSWRLLKHHE